ncbi:MAG: PAS domain S-box protein [Actinomycetia bacterium]|nr:PAS domain S-box protein [Actinomycetes bacterium]
MDRRYAARVTVIYTLMAGLWIVFSDGLLARLDLTASEVSRLSLLKGLAFVAVTALVLYVSVTRGTRRFSSLSDRLSTFIDVAPIPIMSLDLSGRVVLWNPAAEHVFGWSASEVLGQKNPIVAPEQWEAFAEEQRRLPERPNTTGLEVVRLRKDGQRVQLRVFSAAVRDERGRAVGTVGVLEDITGYNKAVAEIERYRDHLEELVRDRTTELSRANEDLQRATDAKDTFLASMSHELRTPLNSIIGFTQILLQGLAGQLNNEQTRQMEMVNAAGRHLLELINDVLDLSKIEAGQTTIVAGPIRISEILTAVEGTVRPMLDAKGLSWECTCDRDDVIITDRRRLEQILLNMLSNAVKFTEKGSVRLSASARGASVRFEVADTGVGIGSESLQRVFGEFVQIETKDAIRPEGTGLGLAISRRLAHLLGGTLAASSQVGVGSTFVLTVPSGAELPEASSPSTSNTRTVLIVDDDTHARGIISAVLRDAGYDVRQAFDGGVALKMVAEEPPDVLLLDLVMPGLDGWEVLKRLKSGADTADIPIICVSILEESEHPPVDGFAGYLVKPIDPAGLLELLDAVLV